MAQDYPNRLAQMIGEEVARRRWSDREAGRRFGNLNHVTVRGLIAGSTKHPSFETFFNVGRYFNVTPEEAEKWFNEPATDATPPAAFRSDNLEIIDPKDYTPEQAADLARIVRGVLRVLESRAGYETEK